MKTIGILGCGNMGAAIIRALASAGSFGIIIYDVNREVTSALAAELAIRTAGTIEELNEQSDLVVLAVKPQILPSLFDILSAKGGQQYISIAAGVSINTLSSGLHSESIVRFMPNIAASVGKAITAIAPGEKASEELISTAQEVASTFGAMTIVPEHLISAFIGISGSAIAFFYQFLHAIALGGTKQGIPYQQSVSIAADTFSGAIELMKQSGSTPASLITSVTSAGGTTIEGIHALEEGGFTGTVMNAVEAASLRGIELEHQA